MLQETTHSTWDADMKTTLQFLKDASQVETSEDYRILLSGYLERAEELSRVSRMLRASLFLAIDDYLAVNPNETATTIVRDIAPSLPEDLFVSDITLSRIISYSMGDRTAAQCIHKGVRTVTGSVLAVHIADRTDFPLSEIVEGAAVMDKMARIIH